MTQSIGQDGALRRGPVLALWAALLLTAAVTVHRIFSTSFTVDEAYSMDTAGRSLAGTLHQATHFELQPPLYFALLNLWNRLSGSPEFARTLSLLCILLALALLFRLARGLGGGVGLAALPLLAALAAPVAWSAMTARGYGLTLLLLIACCHGFVGVWVSDRPAARRELLLFVLAGTAAIYTFYYSGFAVAGLFAAALASGRRRRELLIAAVCLGIAVLPLIPAVLVQVGAHPTQSEGDLHQTNVPMFLLTRTFGLLFWTGKLHHVVGFVLVAGWAGVLAWARLRDGPPRWSRQETLWLLAAFVPWILLLGVEQSGSALVLPRHRVVVLPALLVLLATMLDRIRPPQWRRAATGLTLLTFGLLYISNLRNRDDFDWRAAARVLAEHRAAGEPVVVFTSDGVLPLRWHFREPGALLPLPTEPDLEHYDPAERYLRDSLQVRRRIESVVQPGQSFWLVERQWLPRAAGDSLLARFIEQETVQMSRWTVSGIDLIRLKRKAE